ncbi:hypothetical protein Tco_1298643, partial [Tanacetum coccineum]
NMSRYDDLYGSTRLNVGHLASRSRSRDPEDILSKYAVEYGGQALVEEIRCASASYALGSEFLTRNVWILNSVVSETFADPLQDLDFLYHLYRIQQDKKGFKDLVWHSFVVTLGFHNTAQRALLRVAKLSIFLPHSIEEERLVRLVVLVVFLSFLVSVNVHMKVQAKTKSKTAARDGWV